MDIGSVKAIVTGAARGIGRCFALKLAAAGAQVVAGDSNADGLRSLAEEARGLPGRVATAVVDVASEASIRAFMAEVERCLGTATLLVNNAGILRDGLLVGLDEEGLVRKLPTAQWRAVLDTNVTGPYLLAREFAAALVEAGVRPGLIVNISSVTASGNPGQGNYAAAKAGLDALTRTWALELAPFGIRVAGIAPGLTETPMLGQLTEKRRQEMEAQIPLGRLGQVEDIWEGLRFAIACDYFTGRVMQIDGGATFA